MSIRALWIGFAATLAASGAFAQTSPASASAGYPAKEIRVVVPFAPGGPTEKVGRMLTEAMAKHLSGAKFVIDAQPGDGGTRGTALVAKAPADGYTLLFHHIGFATAPSLYRAALPYTVSKDFDFLGLAINAPFAIVARPTMQANTFAELRRFIETTNAAKRVRIGHAGVGSASHLCAMLFQQSLGVDMETVAFRGTGPALTELQAGGIDVMCDQTTNTVGAIRDKRIKAYAVTDDTRVPSLDLPTLQEAGMVGFEVTAWHGLYAPKGLPEVVAFRLNAALKSALRDPVFRAAMQAEGVEIMPPARQEPGAHRRFVDSEVAKWGAIIRKAGVYAD